MNYLTVLTVARATLVLYKYTMIILSNLTPYKIPIKKLPFVKFKCKKSTSHAKSTILYLPDRHPIENNLDFTPFIKNIFRALL